MIRTSFIRYNPRIIPREFDFNGPFKSLYLDLFNEYAIVSYCVQLFIQCYKLFFANLVSERPFKSLYLDLF